MKRVLKNVTYHENLTHQERLDWVRLARSGGIGPKVFQRLLARYDSVSGVIKAVVSGRVKESIELASERSVDTEYAAVEALGGQLLLSVDMLYPYLLRQLYDPPLVLTVLGDAALLPRCCVAMVGARNASMNGVKFAKRLSAGLARQSIVVVSGLAKGIDGAVHMGALEAEGATVAVVAGGVDYVYPREHRGLWERLCSLGAVVSEHPVGFKPSAFHFPRRNRIVSGLSVGTVVVEATEGSGSLITARMALEQGREVMAVPGAPQDPRARGTNRLLQDGAHLVMGVDDVLQVVSGVPRNESAFLKEETPWEPFCKEKFSVLADEARKKIDAALGGVPVSVEELAAQTGLSFAVLHSVLLDLELDGRIERHPGNCVALAYD